MKRLSYFLYSLVALFMPVLAFAQDKSPLNFDPPPSDVSMVFLRAIFGNVDGVLSGGGSQILGTMFSVFNSAVLTLGAGLIIYMTLVSTLNTANEGELLGKKWSSIWIPIRSAAGVALLIPKASGYCMMQILVMWMVVQGVGAADKVWDAALGYLQRGGVIVQSSSAITGGSAGGLDAETGANTGGDTGKSTAQYQNMLNQSQNMMTAQICMQGLQRLLENQLKENEIKGICPNSKLWYCQSVPSFANSVDIIGAVDTESPSISLPNLDPSSHPGYSKFNGMCGSLSWKQLSKDDQDFLNKKIRGTGTSTSDTDALRQAQQARTIAVQQMFLDLGSIARTVVFNSEQPEDDRLPYGQTANKDTEWVGADNKPPLLTGQELQNAAGAYYSIMAPTLNALQDVIGQNVSFIQDAQKDGWIMAGSYYFQLSQLNIAMTNLTDDDNPVTVNVSNAKSIESNLSNYSWISNTTLKTKLKNLVKGAEITKYYTDSKKLNVRTTAGERPPTFNIPDEFNYDSLPHLDKQNIKAGFLNIPGAILTLLYNYLIRVVINLFIDIMNIILPILGQMVMPLIAGIFTQFTDGIRLALANFTNPITALATLGSKFINITVTIWTTAALLSTLISSIPVVGSGGIALMFFVAPVLMIFLVMLFTTGVMMAYYVPMIPYIIFTYASIGWFIAVLEAMVASPLIALGLMHPEGHEHWGRAEQSIMILLNIFLRPAMMIIGLIASIIIAFVGIWLLNEGFNRATSALITSNQGSIVAGIFIIIIYLTMYTSIVTKACEIITLLPDGVLRFLSQGARESIGGETAGMHKELGGKMERTGGEVAGAAKSGKFAQQQPGKGGAAKSGGGAEASKGKGKGKGGGGNDGAKSGGMQSGGNAPSRSSGQENVTASSNSKQGKGSKVQGGGKQGGENKNE